MKNSERIDKKVRKELNSFETSELERVLEALEWHEYCASGMRKINGGYASATAYDIDSDYDDDTDEDFDKILIELEAGEQNMGDGRSSCSKIICQIDKRILKFQDMELSKKVNAVKGCA